MTTRILPAPLRRAALGVGIAGLLWAACSRPGQPTSPEVVSFIQPVAGVNTPPVINGITVGASRVEVDQTVDVSASVSDAETPVGNLIFNWSANAGTFSGSGDHVSWRLPKGSAPTPVNAVISLTVVERVPEFRSSEGLLLKENRVTRAADSTIRAHDSVAELTALSLKFLVDLFGNSNVSPDACLVDFWDGCTGKADERSDIVTNRATRKILSATANVTGINFKNANTGAVINVLCSFRDIELASGQVFVSDPGSNCQLSAVYEQQRWWLCTSSFIRPNGDVVPMNEFFRRKKSVIGRD